MKHSFKITLVLLMFFLLAQFLGLFILSNYIDKELTKQSEKVVFKDLPIGERPPLDEKTSYLPIILAILLGTGLILLIMKLRLNWLWKFWFLLAVVATLTVAFNAFISSKLVSFMVALGIGLWRIFRPNFWVQNFSEIFVYGGLAAIFVPLLNLTSVSILLVLIALYDAYAVWKSKHMITLAKSQTQAKVFAGLMIPYKLGKIAKKGKGVKVRTALLGGGDIGFPLIFAGVVLKELGLWQSLVIPFFALAGLGFLFWIAKKKKFYPAMPFIGVGCFLGLGIVWLIQLVL